MLVAIGGVLDTPVSTLPGETVPASEPEGLQALSEKPDVLLVTIAGTLGTRRKAWHGNWTPPPSKQQPFARYARELPPKLRHDVHETGPAWT